MATGSGSKKKSTGSGKKRSSETGKAKKTASSTRTAKTTKATQTRTGQYTPRKKTEQERMISDEVSLLIVFTIAVLLFLCNFGIIGPLGNAISGFLFGLFGLLAYIVPIFVCITTAFAISNQGNYMAMLKLSATIVLFLLVGAILQIMQGSLENMEGYSIAYLYTLGKETKMGGGILGGSFAYMLYAMLGTIGAILVLMVIFIVCVVIITEKSFINEVKKGGRYVVSQAKDDVQYRREKAQKRREELEEKRLRQLEIQKEQERQEWEQINQEDSKKILRMDRKVSGVMIDPKLEKNPSSKAGIPSDNIHEITWNDLEQQEVIYSKKETHSQPILVSEEHIEENVQKPMEQEFDFETIRIHGIEEIMKEEAELEETQFSDGENSIKDRDEENKEVLEEIQDEILDGVEEEYGSEEDSILSIQNYDMEDILLVKEEQDLMEEVRVPYIEETEIGVTEDSWKEDREEDLEVAPIQEQQTRVRPVAKVVQYSEKDKVMMEAGQDVKQMRKEASEAPKPYLFPPISCLKKIESKNGNNTEHLKETAQRLQQTLATFGVKVTITDISQGPAVTRYEFQPEQGVKVSKIVSLTDDIKLNLAATDIRMEAPIPGKAAIGIEVPNKENSMVGFRELLESKEFQSFPSKLAFAIGKDIAGKVVVGNIATMPHMLIAGATGSGKSVCINTLIMSILYKATPDEVKLIMIDPKVVELSVYNGIPHLLIPVVTDPKKAAAALQWAVAEMEERYQTLAQFGVRKIDEYNAKIEQCIANGETDVPKKMGNIVIIVDELADLMMVASGEVETAVCRLAQLARAAGIHLIIATQRPSVDVITGLIKANIPSRIAFAVSSGVDSRTILDMNGAEKLLGKGDMLFSPQGYPKPARVQGAFVSDQEVTAVVDFLKNQTLGNTSLYAEEIENKIKNMGTSQASGKGGKSVGMQYDEYFIEAAEFMIEKEKASIGMLQRMFKIGFNRAARIMDQLEDAGVVGAEEGTKPRKVLMSLEQFEAFIEESL